MKKQKLKIVSELTNEQLEEMGIMSVNLVNELEKVIRQEEIIASRMRTKRKK